MVADENLAMGNYLRRQKWMEDLFKAPWWAVPHASSWMKTFSAPHFALAPKSPVQNVLSNNSKSIAAEVIGLSAVVPSLASESSRGIVTAMGIPEMNKSIVQSVLGSTTLGNSAMWAIKSAFSDMPRGPVGMFDHVTEFMPKLGSPALDTLAKKRVESWTRLGAQSVEQYPLELSADETPVSVDELDMDDLFEAVDTIHNQVQELRGQLDAWGTTTHEFAEVDVVYEPVEKQTRSSETQNGVREPLTRSELIGIFLFLLGTLITVTLYLAQESQDVGNGPGLEVPGLRASVSEVTRPVGETPIEIDAADEEPTPRE